MFISSRVHPGETPASFVLDGIWKFLTDETNEQGRILRDKFVFKVVPMLNPDGVIHGNTRAELTGIDPNRVWKKPSKIVTPTVYNIKKQILKTKD